MRPRLLAHAFVVCALCRLAEADETADIPDWQPGPPTVAVTPFENHVANGKSLEWIIAEAPFEIAEKSQGVLGLDATGAPLFVPGEAVPAEPDTVAAYGIKTGADYVVTGWFDRPGDVLRIAVLIWKMDKGKASVVAQSLKGGPPASYHRILGDAMGEAWQKVGVTVDVARAERLGRTLANDQYPTFMMGRGLGYFTGALSAMAGDGKGPDLKAAEHDLERAVFLDPKLYEAQRLIGELYMAEAPTDPKMAAKAAGKFNYAADLAPEDIASLRAAAYATTAQAKWEPALELWQKLVRLRPWDLDARYQLGATLWQLGDAHRAEKQLEQVTAHQPAHLPARRVLVLIHASRSDTPKLVRELEAIAIRAPDDLEVKGDLATAYGALGRWPDAIKALEQVADKRPNDLALLVRIGDAHRKTGDLDGALAWYGRAGKLAPESSLPGFAIAQAYVDAGKLAEASRAYTLLQKYAADLPLAEQALGVIALLQGKADDAAWYLRKAVREEPRILEIRRDVIAAELMRKDAAAALGQLEPALAAWPEDATLHYFAAIAHHLDNDDTTAREELTTALAKHPGMPAAQSAQAALAAGAQPALDYKPELVRPWGDGNALQASLDSYNVLASTIATVRVEYQAHLLALLGNLGSGPLAKGKPPRTCPVGKLAPSWAAAQAALQRYEKLGVELEAEYRFIMKHDELGLTQGLLPNGRTAVADAKKSFRATLADIGELRAEWARGLQPELRQAGCGDRLLAAAVADPMRYRVIEEDKPEDIPTHAPPRAKPRSTFFVDNTRCPDPIDVWIDGAQIGQVAPGRRSALVADGGERTLCLLGPGAAQCGDRGTVRQVYLHDGWSVTVHCPK
ncbi:MAG: tetratricopeptide repeat protein [Deltaproteobacteria bacterium]|nr:tetratricopeptide repeat protein [Deltaproteobacteria bacterium]